MSHRLPPDPEEMNDQRAKCALAAVQSFGTSTSECFDQFEGEQRTEMLAQNVYDLLADLAHMCDREGLNLESLIESASRHYAEETDREGIQFPVSSTERPQALDQRETATVLHALRGFQSVRHIPSGFLCDSHTACDHFERAEDALSNDEIDALCERLNCSDVAVKAPSPAPTDQQSKYIETAREMVAGGIHFDADDIEIDDGPASDGSYPKTSEVEGEGSWVQAWVWVSNVDAGIGEVAEG